MFPSSFEKSGLLSSVQANEGALSRNSLSFPCGTSETISDDQLDRASVLRDSNHFVETIEARASQRVDGRCGRNLFRQERTTPLRQVESLVVS